MRVRTIVACLMLISPPSALACIEHAAEQTGWLHETPSAFRHFAGEGAEASSMLGAWLVAAGSLSLAMVVVGFRASSRARARAREEFGPVEFGPDDGWSPVRPELAGVGQGEEALSGALGIH